jgi:hypothetical protein
MPKIGHGQRLLKPQFYPDIFVRDEEQEQLDDIIWTAERYLNKGSYLVMPGNI